MGVWGYQQGLIVGAAQPGRASSPARSSAAGSGRSCCRTARSRPTRPRPRSPGALLIGGIVAVSLEGVAPRAAPAAAARPRARAWLVDAAGGALLLAALGLGDRLDVRRGRAQRARRQGPAPGRAALGDPQALNEALPALRRPAERAQPDRPRASRSRAPTRTSARPTPGSPAIRRCGRPSDSVVRVLGHGLRARRLGLGLDRGARAWSSPTPTSSPARTTPRSAPATTSSTLDATAGPLRPVERPRAPPGRRPRRRSRCRSPRTPQSGDRGAVLGYPENGAVHDRAGAARARPRP